MPSSVLSQDPFTPRFVDFLIIGAGVAGSNSAYKISKTFPDSKIILLEQFKLFHKNGSSHGNSRIIRCSYDDEVYSQWGIRAISQWKEMEAESGMKVFTKTGGLDWGARDSAVQKVVNICKLNKLEHEVLSSQQIRERFKMINCPDDHIGVFQPDAGVLNAYEAVRMALFLAMKNGVEVREEEKVIEIIPVRGGKDTIYHPLFVIVRTSNGNCFIAKKLVICAGAWTKKCLRQAFNIDVDLEVQRMSYFLWKLSPEYQNDFKKMPVWIYWSKQVDEEKSSNGVPLMDKDHGLGHYGMPALPFEFSDTHFKSGAHFPIESDRNTDPDNRSFETPKEKVELTKRFLSKMFKGVVFETYEEMKSRNQLTTCLYTMTKDENFIIDTIEGHENVVLFAGGSGHAFKFGPVLGEAICHLLEESDTKSLLGRYARDKFSLKKNCRTNNKL